MQPQQTGLRSVLAVAVTAFVLAGLLYGQSRVVSEKSDILRIRRFTGAGLRNLVETPKFQVTTTIQGGFTPQKRWGRIAVQYDTTPEWIDDLSFQFFVLSRKTEPGNKVSFSFYTVTARYMDIKRGQHECTAFLRPVAIERYGEVIAAAVEISSDGKLIAEDTQTEGIKLADRWWRLPAVIESKDVVARAGYLVDREHSPFALVNIDDQEAPRQ